MLARPFFGSLLRGVPKRCQNRALSFLERVPAGGVPKDSRTVSYRCLRGSLLWGSLTIPLIYSSRGAGRLGAGRCFVGNSEASTLCPAILPSHLSKASLDVPDLSKLGKRRYMYRTCTQTWLKQSLLFKTSNCMFGTW